MEKDYLKCLANGILPVPSGKIDIMDPSYDRDTWCATTNLEVRPGDYVGLSYYSDDLFGWGKRTAILQIVHKDYYGKIDIGDDAPWEELSDSLGVDAGMMCFAESPKIEFSDQEWKSFCEKTDGPRKRLGTIQEFQGIKMLVSSSGIGDGCYPLFVLRNYEGEIICAEVRFTVHPFFEEIEK